MNIESFLGELTTLKIGDDGTTNLASITASEDILVQSITSQIRRVFDNTDACGVVIATGDSRFYKGLVAQSLPHALGTGQILAVSCSSFSQRIELGALLFLLAGDRAVDTTSDAEVFHALKIRLRTECPRSPATVVVDNAMMLDARSERLLAQLLNAGCVRLIVVIGRAEQLGSSLGGLLRRRALHLVAKSPLSRSEVNEYLRERLSGALTPGVYAHYWAVSRGNPETLENVLREDLEIGQLIRVENVWVTRKTIATLAAEHSQAELGHDVLRAEELKLLKMINEHGTMAMPELIRSGSDLSALDGLFDLGLVRSHGPGVVESTATLIGMTVPAAPDFRTDGELRGDRSAELLAAVEEIAAGCHDAAAQRLKSMGAAVEEIRLGEEQHLIYELAVCAAHLGTNDFEALAQHWQTTAFADHEGTPAIAVMEQAKVLQWYCAVRQGEPAPVPFADASDGGIWDCLHGFGWADGINRLVGMLCVAHSWILEGTTDSGRKLLNWGIREMERIDPLSRDPRYRLFLPALTFLAHSSAFHLSDWQAASRIDAIILDGPSADATAEHYVAYFACLRALSVGDLEIAGHLATSVKAEESLTDTQTIVNMTQCIDLVMAAFQDGILDWDELRELSRPEILSTNSWRVAQLALLALAEKRPDDRLYEDLNSLARRALDQGLRHCAAETLSIVLALGQPVDSGLSGKVFGAGTCLLFGKLEELNAALKRQDRDEELRVRFELAAIGQRAQVSLLLRSPEKPAVGVLRRVQRALLEGNGHLARFEPSTREARATQIEGKCTGWSGRLTARERTIASLAAEGLRNIEIAKKCTISVRTVEGHLYQIHSKLNIRNRRELKGLLLETTQNGAS